MWGNDFKNQVGEPSWQQREDLMFLSDLTCWSVKKISEQRSQGEMWISHGGGEMCCLISVELLRWLRGTGKDKGRCMNQWSDITLWNYSFEKRSGGENMHSFVYFTPYWNIFIWLLRVNKESLSISFCIPALSFNVANVIVRVGIAIMLFKRCSFILNAATCWIKTVVLQRRIVQFCYSLGVILITIHSINHNNSQLSI